MVTNPSVGVYRPHERAKNSRLAAPSSLYIGLALVFSLSKSSKQREGRERAEKSENWGAMLWNFWALYGQVNLFVTVVSEPSNEPNIPGSNLAEALPP
mgnify:CR=1 FL=1